MNKEEKRAIEKFRKLGIKKFREEKLTNEDLPSYFEFVIILNLIEKLQKENEELRESNKKLYEIGQQMCKQDKYTSENYIPVQKVKDNIEKEIKYHEKNILDIENVNMLKSKTAKEEAEIEFNKYAIVVLKKMLQELIEEREEK
nr:MAG TPA: hypothetical protein [Caudoviricetes sp.]